MNYRDFLQKVIYAIINPLIKAMIAVGITPNIVTFVGFLGNIVAAGFFLNAAWMLGTEQADYASCMVTVGWGGFIILAAGLFDMMDGRLARVSGKSSLFGALWDSTPNGHVVYNVECSSEDDQAKVGRALELTHEKYCGMVQMLRRIAPVSREIAVVSTQPAKA